MNLFRILVVAFSLVGLSASAQEKKEVDISALCDIYRHNLPRLIENDSGLGINPIEISVAGIKMISFEKTTGVINFCPWNDTCKDGGADGSVGHTATSPSRGMSGVGHPKKMGFVVGVFKSSYATPETMPENLDVSKMENISTYGPELEQVFFIGDGRTNKGETQYFLVPNDADILYLGFADGPAVYTDNTGSIHTTIILHATIKTPAAVIKN